MSREPFSVPELIRWRVEQLKAAGKPATHEAIEVSLDCEHFPESEVRIHMVDAIRKFRRLRRVDRQVKVRTVLSPPEPKPKPKPVATEALHKVLSSAFTITGSHLDTAADTLRRHSEKMAHVALAIEELIDEKLQQRAAGNKRPVAEAPMLPGSDEVRPLGFLAVPGVLRWSWAGVHECWVTWGRVEVKVGSVKRSGRLFTGYFRISSEEQLPGQHSMEVAKRRVEDRYREWYEQASTEA